MKKMMFIAALALMSLNCNAWSLKNLLGGSSSTESTTTSTTTNTSSTDAATVVNAAAAVVNSVSGNATAATSQSAAKNYGAGAGSALKSLYTSYTNNNKKINTKDLTTYTNILSVVTNCECLKENYKDKEYMKEYGLGLIEGSLGLVTQSNVNQVSNSLLSIANEAVGDDKVATVANTASSLSSLFSLFK